MRGTVYRIIRVSLFLNSESGIFLRMRYTREGIDRRIVSGIKELAQKLGCEPKDIRQEMRISEWQARQRWDSKLGAPREWFVNRAGWQRYRSLERQAKRGERLLTLAEVPEPATESSVLASMVAEEIVNMLRPRLVGVLTEILVNDRTLREVAERDVVSTTRIFHLLKQGKERLRDLASRN